MIRIFNQVPKVIFSRGSLNTFNVLMPKDVNKVLVLIDDVHKKTNLHGFITNAIASKYEAVVIDVNVNVEPKTGQVDSIVSELKSAEADISAVIGVGGGSVLDIAKAVAVMLRNPGSASEYQGWDLVKNPSLFKLGIPTLSGTGAEASRTAVLTGPEKKFGINSDYSQFDAVVLDADLIKDVPVEQRFYTGMDCYIHSVEALNGSMINEMGRAFADKALQYCNNVFLDNGSDDELMVASYFGGCSVANSEVGVCHALSYGLSLVLGYRHGIANCVVFDQLQEYYPDGVAGFRRMLAKNAIKLPRNVTEGMSGDNLQRMIDMTLRMERPLTNALGPDFRDILTPDKIRELYSRM